MFPDVQRERGTSAPDDPTLPPVSSQPFSWSAASEHGGNWLLRLLGIGAAVGGGIALGYALPTMVIGPDVLLWLFVLALVAWAVLAAGLLQSWWALLIVPILSVVGLFIGSAYQAHGGALRAWFTSGVGDLDIVVALIVVPWVVGAVIGTPLGKWLEERLRR